MYVIYTNKERMKKHHLQTLHAMTGFVLMISFIIVGMVGGIVLHPDFGYNNTNPSIRFAHKVGARIIIVAAWVNALLGLQKMGVENHVLFMFGVPLLFLLPFSLL
jgi:predicted DNA repair protein MutK